MRKSPNVALFATCLVDLFRPSVGFAAVKLLEEAGCRVDVPLAQTCCGQPAWNSGARKDAREIAEAVIKTFEPYDYVVVPSGSCAGMLKKHYLEIFEKDTDWTKRAKKFSRKVYELTVFLADIARVKKFDAVFKANVTYHDGCAGLRELGISNQPRKLLRAMNGITLTRLKDCETCCGFGGTFAVKYADISNAIVTEKADNAEASGAQILLAGDLGCLFNIAGKLKRNGSKMEVRHIAEVLAGMVTVAAIGERE